MAVDEPDKIDVIATKDNQLILVITDHLDWSNPDQTANHLTMIQDKLNTYYNFMQGDDILAHQPDARNMVLSIEIVFAHAPDDKATEFLSYVGEEFAKDGYKFGYKIAVA